MKNKGLYYIAGGIVLLWLFRDIINNTIGEIIPDIGGAVGGAVGAVGGVVEHLARQQTAWQNDAQIKLWIHDGFTAAIVYAVYQTGMVTYLQGFRYLNNEYGKKAGQAEYASANEWAASQLEEYSGYGA